MSSASIGSQVKSQVQAKSLFLVYMIEIIYEKILWKRMAASEFLLMIHSQAKNTIKIYFNHFLPRNIINNKIIKMDIETMNVLVRGKLQENFTFQKSFKALRISSRSIRIAPLELPIFFTCMAVGFWRVIGLLVAAFFQGNEILFPFLWFSTNLGS